MTLDQHVNGKKQLPGTLVTVLKGNFVPTLQDVRQRGYPPLYRNALATLMAAQVEATEYNTELSAEVVRIGREIAEAWLPTVLPTVRDVLKGKNILNYSQGYHDALQSMQLAQNVASYYRLLLPDGFRQVEVELHEAMEAKGTQKV